MRMKWKGARGRGVMGRRLAIAIALLFAVTATVATVWGPHQAGAVGEMCNKGGGGGQDCAQDGSEVCQSGSCVCAAGYGYTGDDCVECGFQFYKSSAGDEACSETIRCDKGERWFKPSNTEDATCPGCQSGKYQDKTGHRDTQCYDPSTCEAGKYVTQEPNTKQDRECGLCEPGKYTAIANQPSCRNCPGGKYQNAEGQSGCKDPTVCMPGEYIKSDRTPTTNRYCFKCVAGTYIETRQASECKTCDSGKYQDRDGQTECKNWRTCGPGKKWKAGSTTDDATCPNCGPGKYQDETGHQEKSCKKCPEGEFQPGSGASSCEAWMTCGQGQKWTKGSATENAGCLPCGSQEYQSKIAHQDKSCDPWTTCSSGYYVTADPTSSSDRTCDKCDAGTYGDAMNADSCKGCGTGKYQDASGQTDCKEWKMCGQGEKWTTGSSTEDATCSPCSTLHYQSKTSHQDTSCTSWSTCGPGYEVTIEPTASNDRLCAMCDYGHYQDGTNQQDCKPCDPGQHQDERGQTECKACGAGKYQGSSGEKDCITYSTCDAGTKFVTGTTTEDRTCVLCEAGKFRADTGHRLSKCEACADDTFQSDEGQSSCMVCNECDPGYVIDQDCTPTSDRTCKDIAKPTIVLRRPDNNEEIQDTYVVEATFAFDPPIFTATDTAAGTVTKTPPPNIDDIDTSTVRSDQMLTYKATDANMNTATRDITVEVVDTTGPAITFDPAVLQLEAGEEVMRSNFTAGVSIVDRVDGTLGINLLEYDASDVNVNTLGMYEVVYTLSAPDSNDNEAPPTTRTAAVVDTLPPVITIGFGDRNVSEHNVVIHEAATEFIFPSQSAFDTFDPAVNGGDVRRNEEPTFSSVVDDGTQFTFTYTATDASDNTAMVVYVIEVRDTMAPTITISGEHNITHEAGTEYVDAGATATDLLEDAIGRGVEVVVTNNVLSKPPSVPAVFTVEYDACDKAGNCDAINRTVHVLDRTAPSIELIGDALLVVEAGSNFTDIDPGVTLADLYYDNADLTLVIDDGGYEAAPTATPVSFNVTYTVTDPSRNTASVTRTITIIDTTPPDLRVNGNLSVTVGDGVTWVEPGIARAYDIVDRDVRSRVVATTQLEEAGVVVPTMCAYSSARAFVPPLSPRVWSSPRMDAVESRAPSGTVYRINYTVADAASNVAFVERVVQVADPTPPSLQLLGDRVQALEYGPDAAFVEADGGAVSADTHDGDLSGDVCVGVSIVTRDASGVVAPGDVRSIGEAAITYVLSLARNASTTTAPPPTTSTASTTTMNADTSNSNSSSSTATTTTAAGTTAADMFGLDAAVASAEVGTVYVLQYSVHDRAGNAAVGVQRAVVVVDTTPPEVTLYGAEEVHVPYATRYVEAGYSAQDVHDGNVTSQVVVSGADAIDVHVAGTYEIEYAVTDANGNTGVAVRTVVVEALMRPERADQVVELVLAGTAESIFGGDVQQLERDLEEALNVDFVVVFLVYDKALGRPTTDINTVPQQQQGRKRRRSSGGSSRDSDNNDNNYSHNDNAGIRGRRGLLAQPSTVVEFGVRNGTSLEWVPADILLARFEGLETLAATRITSVASAAKRGGGSDGGAVAGAVVGVLLVLVVLVAAVVVYKRRPDLFKRSSEPKDSFSGKNTLSMAPGPFEFRNGDAMEMTAGTVMSTTAGAAAAASRMNGARNQLSSDGHVGQPNFSDESDHDDPYNSSSSSSDDDVGGDGYGSDDDTGPAVSEVRFAADTGELRLLASRHSGVELYSDLCSANESSTDPNPKTAPPAGLVDVTETLRAGAATTAHVPELNLYEDVSETAPVPPSPAPVLPPRVAPAVTDDTDNMYDVPKKEAVKPKHPPAGEALYEDVEATGKPVASAPPPATAVASEVDDMYDVPRREPRVKAGATTTTQATPAATTADVEDDNMYDVPKARATSGTAASAAAQQRAVDFAPSLYEDVDSPVMQSKPLGHTAATASSTTATTATGGSAGSGSVRRLPQPPRAATVSSMPTEAPSSAGTQVYENLKGEPTGQEAGANLYSVPHVAPASGSTASSSPSTLAPPSSAKSATTTRSASARQSRPSTDGAHGVGKASASTKERRTRAPTATSKPDTVRRSSGSSAAEIRRSTLRAEDMASEMAQSPAYLNAGAQAGFVGFMNRKEVEELLSGREQGTYLWRLSRNAPGAVLSVHGRHIVEHHVFTRDASSGAIVMNMKPLSTTCTTLDDVVALLGRSTELSTVLLKEPAVPGLSEVTASEA